MLNKYIIFGFISTLIVVVFLALDARNASSQVKGGFHDLSFSGQAKYKYDTFQVCIFCHTPHNANETQGYTTNPSTEAGGSTLGGKYLWNRRIPTHAWKVYTSSTLHADTSGGPGPLSLLCLSCHDGIGAMNVLLKYPSDTATPGVFYSMGITDNQFGDAQLTDPNIGPLNIGEGQCSGDNCTTGGGELQNDHPIGFIYADARALDPTGLNIITDPALTARMVLTGGRMECNTCHDPHITNPVGAVKNKFLVMDNTGSAMCLACHNK